MPAKKPATKAEKPASKPVKKSVQKKAPAKKKTTTKKPAKPVITDKDFEVYFAGLTKTKFLAMVELWNEKNLKIKIKQQKDYDGWLNYFKKLPAAHIRYLVATGQEILDAEAFAALRRWSDIISNPHRIEKIHQAGLTNETKDKKVSIVEMANKNDRYGVLCATRDNLATKLEKHAGIRETAQMSAQLTEIMAQIADYERRQGPKKSTVLGQLLDDMPGAPKTKRPGKNGGGARNTSFKARVTIDDLED